MDLAGEARLTLISSDCGDGIDSVGGLTLCVGVAPCGISL